MWADLSGVGVHTLHFFPETASWNHFILYMHISQGGLFNVCENWGLHNKAVGTVLWLGGAKNNFVRRNRAKFFYITLTYKKDTILFISISAISKIHSAISLF